MSATTTSQYAAVEAMRTANPDIAHMREEYDRRRRYLVENLNRIGLSCFEPKGAFYVFPCIRSSGWLESSASASSGRRRWPSSPALPSDPGGEGYVRACYASSMRDHHRVHQPPGQLPPNCGASRGRSDDRISLKSISSLPLMMMAEKNRQYDCGKGADHNEYCLFGYGGRSGPEIWIAFAEASGIPELKRTTRDEPDYDS